MIDLKIDSKLVNWVVTKKAKKYLKDINIENLKIEKQEDGSYKAHINCDISLYENQVSQILQSVL